MDDSFIDLRLNHGAAQAEESFWPSFTDIMTVIVMIFLLAMVILLLRNMELVKELRATMASKQQAVELARSTGEENQTLEEKLLAREYELSMLRMKMLRMKEQAQQREQTLSQQRSQLSALSQQRDRLSDQLDQITRQRDDLNIQVDRLGAETTRLRDQLVDANKSIENLNQDLSHLTLRQQASQREIAALRDTNRTQKERLAAAQARTLEQDQSLARLQTNYQDLKIKYDKLVRPARTSRGKTVVEVRYRKVKGKYLIDLRPPGSDQFKLVSRKQLERYLTRLKEQQPNGLYIKVILPKNSGLSYSEAWSFTNHLQQTYDYYFQEEAKKERMPEE